jgi:hypothetical protein
MYHHLNGYRSEGRRGAHAIRAYLSRPRRHVVLFEDELPATAGATAPSRGSSLSLALGRQLIACRVCFQAMRSARMASFAFACFLLRGAWPRVLALLWGRVAPASRVETNLRYGARYPALGLRSWNRHDHRRSRFKVAFFAGGPGAGSAPGGEREGQSRLAR